MDNIIVGIHQPNFFPWLGYFVKIARSEKFVLLDDAQFPKTGGSYVNRVELLVQGSRQWLMVPIKRFHGVWNINESEMLDNKWRNKLLQTLQSNYAKAPFFNSHKEFVFELINYNTNLISAFNINVIRQIVHELKIDAEILVASDMSIPSQSTQRLIDLVRAANGNVYISGGGGDNYQEKELFELNNIKLIYNSFEHPVYCQLKTEKFEKGLSIIDAIFNTGINNIAGILKQHKHEISI